MKQPPACIVPHTAVLAGVLRHTRKALLPSGPYGHGLLAEISIIVSFHSVMPIAVSVIVLKQDGVGSMKMVDTEREVVEREGEMESVVALDDAIEVAVVLKEEEEVVMT